MSGREGTLAVALGGSKASQHKNKPYIVRATLAVALGLENVTAQE